MEEENKVRIERRAVRGKVKITSVATPFRHGVVALGKESS